MKTDWEKMIAIANLNAPREQSDSPALPIEISGFDCSGRYFTERTTIVSADASRCSFHVRAQVPYDSVVAICFVRRNSRTKSRSELFEVVHTEKTLSGWHIEATRLLPDSVVSIRKAERSYRAKRTP